MKTIPTLIFYLILSLSSFSQSKIDNNDTTKSVLFKSPKPDKFCGIWQNCTDSENQIKIYPAEHNSYLLILTKQVIDESDSTYFFTRKSCMIREKDELMFTSGPFQGYGTDGYFIKNGKDIFYYDWLLNQYMGEDSLKYLYKKTSNLPNNWCVLPEDRIGEEGIVTKNKRYLITKINNVEKTLDDEALEDFWSIQFGEYEQEIRIPISRIQDFPYLYSLFTSNSLNPSKLVGEIIKITFPLNGYIPGTCYQGMENWVLERTCFPLLIEEVEGIKGK